MIHQRRIAFFLCVITLFVSVCCRATSLSIWDERIGYAHAITDQESGLQYLNARYYNTKLMRFASWDTMPLMNRYAYADGNPMMNTDPSGHRSVTQMMRLDPTSILQGIGLSGNVATFCGLLAMGAVTGRDAVAARLTLFFSALLGGLLVGMSMAITNSPGEKDKTAQDSALGFAILSLVPVPVVVVGPIVTSRIIPLFRRLFAAPAAAEVPLLAAA